ncbi:hypothetical protein D3C73_756970 [compost metagenome]
MRSRKRAIGVVTPFCAINMEKAMAAAIPINMLTIVTRIASVTRALSWSEPFLIRSAMAVLLAPDFAEKSMVACSSLTVMLSNSALSPTAWALIISPPICRMASMALTNSSIAAFRLGTMAGICSRRPRAPLNSLLKRAANSVNLSDCGSWLTVRFSQLIAVHAPATPRGP